MLTIICGEDSIESRNYYYQLKQTFRHENKDIHDLPASKLYEITQYLAESVSLFAGNLVIFTENLNKLLSKRNNPKYFALVENLIRNKNVQIVDWEGFTPARNLKISQQVTIKEFKLAQSIFKLLDSCYPGNLKSFVSQLHDLPDKIDEFFIFSMLIRHTRNLILVKTSQVTGTLQKWQVAKLKMQAHFWDPDSLIYFYDSLYRIDVAIKSSKTPFSIKESLDIAAFYFL